jgi:hypothetical protein
MPDDTRTVSDPAGRVLYQTDEHARIAALAEGSFDRLDRPNLIEYLTELTIRDRRELESRMTVVLHHLLKIGFQPEKARKTGIDVSRFPPVSPWTVEAALAFEPSASASRVHR